MPPSYKCNLIIIPFHMQDESPAGFKEALIDKTLHLFPSLDLAALPSYLLHSQAVSAYDSVWVLASVWDKVLSKGKKLCSNRTALVLKMNQVMKHVLVSSRIGKSEAVSCYLKRYGVIIYLNDILLCNYREMRSVY